MVLQQGPSQSAVYGTVIGNTTNVSVTVSDETGASYSVAAVVSNGMWKALLRPAAAGGNYSIVATAFCVTENASTTIEGVTFGDVW